MKAKKNTKKAKESKATDFLLDVVKDNIKKIAGILIIPIVAYIIVDPILFCKIRMKEIEGEIDNATRLWNDGDISEALDTYNEILKEIDSKRAWSYCCKEKYSEMSGKINLRLGDYYYENPKDELSAVDNFEAAFGYYNNALEMFTYESNPYFYSEVNKGIGNLYLEYSKNFSREDNLDNALDFYGYAAMVCDNESVTEKYDYFCEDKYARLGNAYCKYSDVENKQGNIEQAFIYYEKSKAFIKEEENSFEHGNIQYYMGCAYCSLAEAVDTEDNLRKGIKSIEDALEVIKVDEHPEEYAMAHLDRAIAYLRLYDEKNDTGYLGNCRDSIRHAEKVFDKTDYPYEYAITKLKYALYYMKLFTVANNADFLAKAKNECEEAETILNIKTYPYDYAMAQYMLGVIHLNYYSTREWKQDLGDAVDCFKDAGELFKFREFSYAYTETEEHLGKAYRMLAEAGISEEENKTLAREHLNNATKICDNECLFGNLTKHCGEVKNELMKLEALP